MLHGRSVTPSASSSAPTIAEASGSSRASGLQSVFSCFSSRCSAVLAGDWSELYARGMIGCCYHGGMLREPVSSIKDGHGRPEHRESLGHLLRARQLLIRLGQQKVMQGDEQDAADQHEQRAAWQQPVLAHQSDRPGLARRQGSTVNLPCVHPLLSKWMGWDGMGWDGGG